MPDIQELDRVTAPPRGAPDWHTMMGVRPKKPSLWHVVLLNDDFTPMEFVTTLLKQIFHKTSEEATAIMLEVHEKGHGIAGTYTLEVAEMKALEVLSAARRADHPLLAVVQEAPV